MIEWNVKETKMWYIELVVKPSVVFDGDINETSTSYKIKMIDFPISHIAVIETWFLLRYGMKHDGVWCQNANKSEIVLSKIARENNNAFYIKIAFGYDTLYFFSSLIYITYF